MKPFLHVDDFGVSGFRQLSGLLTTAGKVKIWSPSAFLLGESQSIFEAADILWLIENGFLTVTGRREWIYDRAFRDKHPWDYARWDEELDSPIRRMATEDENLPLSQKRVIVAEAEKGEDRAKGRLLESDGLSLQSRLRRLFNRELLPVGIQEKAQRARKERRSVPRQILRDYYNHLEAISESGADSMASPDKLLLLITRELGEVLEPAEPNEAISIEDLQRALNVITRISSMDEMSDFKQFLKSNHRREIQEMVFEYRDSGVELPQQLANRLSGAVGSDSIAMRLSGFNQGRVQGTVTVGSMLSGFLSYLADPTNPWSLWLIAIGTSVPFLENMSLIKKKVKDRKVQALIYLAHQRSSATKKEILNLIQRLEKL